MSAPAAAAQLPILGAAGLSAQDRDVLVRDTLDTNPDGVVITDRSGTVLEWSAGAARLFGWSRLEAIGHPLHALIVPPEARAAHCAGLARCARGEGGALIGARTRLAAHDRDGRAVPVELTLGRVERRGAVWFTARCRDIAAELAHERRIALLNGELMHRAGNLLAVIGALVRMTRRSAADLDDFAGVLGDRIAALGAAHELLRAGAYRGAELGDLARAEQAIYGAAALELDGPRVPLNERATQTLGLCIHEMLTNALKHGALSCPGGRVRFAWHVESGGADDRATLVMDWCETGGPDPTARPAGTARRRGFGSRLVKDGLEQDLGGTMTLDYRPAGLVARTRVPLGNVERQDEPAAGDDGAGGAGGERDGAAAPGGR